MTSGAPVSVEFALTATNCQPAGFSAFPPRGRDLNPPRFIWSATAERPDTAPNLERVEASVIAGAATTLPKSARGRDVGVLHLFGRDPDSIRPQRSFRLRAPRRGSLLLSRGSLRVTLTPGPSGCCRRFLSVRGLPAATQRVDLEFTGAGRALVRVPASARRYSVVGRLVAGGRIVSITSNATFPEG